MKVWIDCTNTPQVHVILPLIKHLKHKHETIITARNFSETIPLLEQNGITPVIFGSYWGKNKINKSFGLLTRSIKLHHKLPNFDMSFSLGGNYTSFVSHLRKKPSIVFSDNDISFKYLAYHFGTDFIFPEYFNTSNLTNEYGIREEQINKFNGFKEDIYIAEYKPDPLFPEKLPFNNFITIRPENLKASYIRSGSRSIVPELFNVLKDENILFLPRYAEERKFSKGYSNIFIPEEPLNGLDVCYYSKSVLTGAGTFAREAALLGTPAVSFFPGSKTLTVDKILREEGKQFFSRNTEEIYHFVKTSEKRTEPRKRSEFVLNEVLSIIDNIMGKYSV